MCAYFAENFYLKVIDEQTGRVATDEVYQEQFRRVAVYCGDMPETRMRPDGMQPRCLLRGASVEDGGVDREKPIFLLDTEGESVPPPAPSYWERVRSLVALDEWCAMSVLGNLPMSANFGGRNNPGPVIPAQWTAEAESGTGGFDLPELFSQCQQMDALSYCIDGETAVWNKHVDDEEEGDGDDEGITEVSFLIILDCSFAEFFPFAASSPPPSSSSTSSAAVPRVPSWAREREERETRVGFRKANDIVAVLCEHYGIGFGKKPAADTSSSPTNKSKLPRLAWVQDAPRVYHVESLDAESTTTRCRLPTSRPTTTTSHRQRPRVAIHVRQHIRSYRTLRSRLSACPNFIGCTGFYVESKPSRGEAPLRNTLEQPDPSKLAKAFSDLAEECENAETFGKGNFRGSRRYAEQTLTVLNGMTSSERDSMQTAAAMRRMGELCLRDSDMDLAKSFLERAREEQRGVRVETRWEEPHGVEDSETGNDSVLSQAGVQFLYKHLHRVNLIYEPTKGADVIDLDVVLNITKLETAAEVRAKIVKLEPGSHISSLPAGGLTKLPFRFMAHDPPSDTFGVVSRAQESDRDFPVLRAGFAVKNESGGWDLLIRGSGVLARAGALDPEQAEILRGELDGLRDGGGGARVQTLSARSRTSWKTFTSRGTSKVSFYCSVCVCSVCGVWCE
jgi:hypothetical protein